MLRKGYIGQEVRRRGVRPKWEELKMQIKRPIVLSSHTMKIKEPIMLRPILYENRLLFKNKFPFLTSDIVCQKQKPNVTPYTWFLSLPSSLYFLTLSTSQFSRSCEHPYSCFIFVFSLSHKRDLKRTLRGCSLKSQLRVKQPDVQSPVHL